MPPFLHRVPLPRQCRIGPRSAACVRIQVHAPRQYRRIVTIPTVLLPPVVFGGLVIVLWTWKCLMMVVFQRRIIFMPGLPPNARREKISDYANQCGGIQWREERIQVADRTRISLCIASVESGSDIASPMKTVYILYFQGNASSLPPRLPFLSPVLRRLKDDTAKSGIPIRYIMVCCSYRGYWTSQGHPSEKGIAKDAAGTLAWIRNSHYLDPHSNQNVKVPIIVWGQSIGAGVAASLAAEGSQDSLVLEALILETPFLSIRAMLETLYPQKWLPYRYLWPFLRTHLDSWNALGLVHKRFGVKAPYIMILEAEKDELVPSSHGEILEKRCKDLGLNVRKRVVHGALHTEALVRQEGMLAVVETIQEVAQGAYHFEKKAKSLEN